MNDFKSNKRFSGGEKRGGGSFSTGKFGFGNKDFNRPNFGGSGAKRDFRGGEGKNMEMFEAICADCGKTCEVPFKPNGRKPVYCRECFAKNGGPLQSQDSSSNRFPPKRDFGNNSSYKPAYKPEYKPDVNNGVGELKKQIEAMNAKLDKLVWLMTEGNMSSNKPDTLVVETNNKKEPVKKSVSKKKK
jgi:CxxC-x17-CxxC domain-containing protein